MATPTIYDDPVFRAAYGLPPLKYWYAGEDAQGRQHIIYLRQPIERLTALQHVQLQADYGPVVWVRLALDTGNMQDSRRGAEYVEHDKEGAKSSEEG